jgi:hypothetical protein
MIKQKRLALRAGSLEGAEETLGSSLDAAAAMQAVEAWLAYQHLEVTVSAIQAAVESAPAQETGSEKMHATTDNAQARQCVLQPTQFAALLRLNRIPEVRSNNAVRDP